MEVWLLLMDGCGLSIGLDGEHSLDYWQDGTRDSLLVVLWSLRCLHNCSLLHRREGSQSALYNS